MIPKVKSAASFTLKGRLVETAAENPEEYNKRLKELRQRAIDDEFKRLKQSSGPGVSDADLRKMAERSVDQRRPERDVPADDPIRRAREERTGDAPISDEEVEDIETPSPADTTAENPEDEFPIPPEVEQSEPAASPGTKAQQETEEDYNKNLNDFFDTIIETGPSESGPSTGPQPEAPRTRAEILDDKLNVNKDLFNYVGRFAKKHALSDAVLRYLNEIANDLPKIKSNPVSSFIFSLFENPMELTTIEGLNDARFKNNKVIYRYVGTNRSLSPSSSNSSPGADVTPYNSLQMNGMTTVPRSTLLRAMEEVKRRGFSTALTERNHLPVYMQNYVGRSGKGITSDAFALIPRGVEKINPGPDGFRYVDATPVGYLHYTNTGVWLLILDRKAYSIMKAKATNQMLKNRRLVLDPNNPNADTSDAEARKRELKRRTSSFILTPFTKLIGFVNASRNDYKGTKNALIGDLLLSYIPFAGGTKQFYRQKVSE